MRRLIENYITFCRYVLIIFALFIGVREIGAQIGAPIRIVKASQLIPYADATAGCNPVTTLNNASATCADDQSYLNAFLATATVNKPVDLIFDVSACGSKSLQSPANSYVTIEGVGNHATGYCILPASNTAAIGNVCSGGYCNAGNWSGSAPSITAGTGVVIRNMTLNGNRGTYPNGNSNHVDARCSTASPYLGWCTIVAIANVAYLEETNDYFYDAPSFASDSSNVTYQVYRNISCVPANHTNSNTDCIHMDGPAGKFMIDGVYANTGDDLIAANMPEGYAGSIGGGTIANVSTDDALALFRSYCGATGSFTLGPVSITNFSGTLGPASGVSEPALVRFGLNGTGVGVADCIQSVHVSNGGVTLSNVSGNPEMVDVQDNVGDLELSNVTWNAPSAAKPFVQFLNSGTTSNFVCHGCTIYRNATGNSAAFCATVTSGSTVKNYDSDCQPINEQGQSYAALSYLVDVQSGGAITTMVRTTPLTSLISAVTNGNEWSRITNATGAGWCAPGIVNTVTFSATPVFDLSLGCTQQITLTGNVTSSTLQGPTIPGANYNWIIKQDGTGSRTFVSPVAMKGFFTIGSTASKANVQNFVSDSAGVLYGQGAGSINQ